METEIALPEEVTIATGCCLRGFYKDQSWTIYQQNINRLYIADFMVLHLQ